MVKEEITNDLDKKIENINPKWWDEDHAFFGDFYIEGDNSKEGYLTTKELTLNERTKGDIDGVEKLLNLKGGEKILDVPCGYGRHSLELARRGFKVYGSDINTVHLNNAVKQAEDQRLKINFTKENMLDLNYKEKFDAVINMCYSFGFFENDIDNKKTLENFYKALKPNGKFLMETDVNLPYVRAGNFKEEETRTLLSGNKLHITEKYNPATKRMEGTWTIAKPDGTTTTKEYSVRVFEKDEFIEWCLETGFINCRAFSDWEGNSYDEKAQEIIFVAEK